MTTTGISSWAVDLAEVGAVYPFQGMEVIMVIIGVVFWIWWHIVTFRMEFARQEKKIAEFGNPDQIVEAIEKD